MLVSFGARELGRDLRRSDVMAHQYVTAANVPASQVGREATTLKPRGVSESVSARSPLLTQRALQTKLEVSEPGDPYELEADRIADQVMASASPVAAPALSDEGAGVQRKCGACPAGAPCPRCAAEDQVQRKGAEFSALPVASAPGPVAAKPAAESVESAVAAVSATGNPLPDSARRFFETRLGQDFSAVRVHTDGRAAEAARALSARAFTSGRNIAFAPGQYDPESTPGRALLAHELTHVVQQTPLVLRKPSDLESEDELPE